MNTHPKQTATIILTFLTIAMVQATANDLTITRTDSKMILTWLLGITNDFYLQFATNLSPQTVWIDASDPTTNGTILAVTDDAPITNTSRFYRLEAWEVLFDGTSTAEFRGYRQVDFPASDQWTVTTNGELLTVSNAAPVHLITRAQYGSYELRWEWKTSSDGKGNSGVQYRVTENYSESGSAGPEYQLLGDIHASVPENQTIGAVWGLFAPTNTVLIPGGEWNQCRLILQSNHVQHWLNGRKVVEYDINSAAWTNALKAHGSYLNVPGFGQGTSPGVGYIMLRNDAAPTWFRNIKIRALPLQ